MRIYGCDIKVGDFVRVRIVNAHGDLNLNGRILSGKVKDEVPDYDMLRLESGWCCHAKDELLTHAPQDIAEEKQASA